MHRSEPPDPHSPDQDSSDQRSSDQHSSGRQSSDQDLRTRLVGVGVDLVSREGVGALTLREIARRAGVSHGAPRRYFPTHLELLSAIAHRGFTDLGVRVTASGSGDGASTDPRQRVAELSHFYLEFALENPGMYELMFRHDLLESGHLRL